MTTPEDIAKVRALCEAVEPGPWEPEIGTHACCVLASDRKQVAAALGLDTATFIAAARTLVPEALDEVERLQGELEDMRERKDAAYLERTRVVALLARLFPSGLRRTDIPGWHPEWHGCVYIDLPTGQVSWHYHQSASDLFAGLPDYEGAWDGHDTEEKYRRLSKMTFSPLCPSHPSADR